MEQICTVYIHLRHAISFQSHAAGVLRVETQIVTPNEAQEPAGLTDYIIGPGNSKNCPTRGSC